ncbi:hypothetical protein OH460_07505 [Vibrio sp. Makdt]|uniref:hypothetical protein n=1 Tax=Vibrio sp. Makdt TaxID=2998828 RepID=UPI0022CDB519|nr:hypothetical protein [Vibrio sp. Makdt]MDA0152143.1 hypothetical protein [Vibrio sp. Makdt]
MNRKIISKILVGLIGLTTQPHASAKLLFQSSSNNVPLKQLCPYKVNEYKLYTSNLLDNEAKLVRTRGLEIRSYFKTANTLETITLVCPRYSIFYGGNGMCRSNVDNSLVEAKPISSEHFEVLDKVTNIHYIAECKYAVGYEESN